MPNWRQHVEKKFFFTATFWQSLVISLSHHPKKNKDMTNKTETLSREKSVSPHAGAWLWIAIAVLYSIAPLDFVPDVITPYGWVDDIIVVVISLINLIQSYLKPKNEALAKIIKRIKWIVIGLAPLVAIALAVVVLCTKIF